MTRTSRIAASTSKQARSGPLVFVTVEHEIATRGAASRSREEHDIVYRELPAPGDERVPAAAAPADETFARGSCPTTCCCFAIPR